ncbi:MAG: signal peptidase I [Microbacterium ginsengisoli]|uniref:signal peptidase I n=1 Tax=Microbacterium TaxID=33882 RepID=UPI0006F82D30|nr:MULTISPECIES: signal peptidase I [unclassified Microbacterium]MBN9197174.1 signal peptidase I [Microbacterium ginsengisoli]KQR91165.1 S26 family signal peptidase [Microbacterium sp. Leaf347]KQS01175.1 S26 family signal peptidase [Microbacterium sp. Leaf351]ODU79023.1 MAG: signal peptidase I [Microbacterium sp. SCN 71-21]OJU77120.1 MAG: signal peptidase I [Microbacterium sp. 71-23]
MTTEEHSLPDETPSAPIRTRRRGGPWRFARDVVVVVVIAVLVSFLVKTFVVRSFYIPSASMETTLMEQDRILVDEITPNFGGYQRGDIVVFKDPGGWLDPSTTASGPQNPIFAGIDWVLSLVGLSTSDSDDHLIKRIIGLPGDHVVCCNAAGQITVNGQPIDEQSYITVPSPGAAASGIAFDVTVPQGSLWVLGDNRYRSKDSRYNQDQPGKGFVPVSDVVGRAFLITWPFSRFGALDFHHDVFAGVPGPSGSPVPSPTPTTTGAP